MNNEPVAWMDSKGYLIDTRELQALKDEGFTCIPLYTHPAELTDEEIWNLMDEIEVLVHGDIKRAMFYMAKYVMNGGKK